MKKIVFVILMSGLFMNCSQTKTKVALPYKTSLGNLVSVEKKDTVKTSRTPDMGQFRIPEIKTHISSAEEDLYLLSFEGIDSVTAINKGEETKEKVSFDFEVDQTISGEDGKEIRSIFVGYLNEESMLTNDNAKLTLVLPESDTGHYTMVTHFPVAKIKMLYRVPKNTSPLFLKDGKNQFQIR